MGTILKAKVHKGKRLKGISKAFARALSSFGDTPHLAVAFREQTDDPILLAVWPCTQHYRRCGKNETHREAWQHDPSTFHEYGQIARISTVFHERNLDNHVHRD